MFDYFNAFTALSRLDDLIEDAEKLKNDLDLANPVSGRWHPWFGNEIVSYFAIGFVTCLEWHARSRIADSLAYKPSAAQIDDLKVLKEKVVLEMMTANVTVASIVGATTQVSSLDDYTRVFNRLLSTFDQSFDASKAMKAKRSGTAENWIEGHEIEELQGLFQFRHELVHEIGINRVGHKNIRDSWDPDEAIKTGELVKRAMSAIEAAIVMVVPKDFPNLLDIEGYPVSEIDRLQAEISELENGITKSLGDWHEEESGEIIGRWEKAQKASKLHQFREIDFVETLNLAGWQYFDERGPLKLHFLKARSNYLKELGKTLGDTVDLIKD